MKILDRSKLKSVAQALGLLGLLLAVGFAILDATAMGAAASGFLNDLQVSSEPGAFLLVGSGIAGFVYLAVRRRKVDGRERRA